MPTIELSSFKAFAFDFDGTLANTNATHDLARQKAFEKMAAETGDARYVTIPQDIKDEAHRHGSNPMAIIGWVLQATGLVKDLSDEHVVRTVDYKREIYAELCREGLDQIPNSVEFARHSLRLLPHNVGITTTAHKDSEVMPFLRRYDLYPSISDEHLITCEDVGPDHMKPDPLAYRLTLERFGLAAMPDKLLIFEDTPGGVASAKATGAVAVAVTTTHSREDFLAPAHLYKPDLIVSDFAELIKMIE